MFTKVFSPITLLVFVSLVLTLTFLERGTAITWTLVIPLVPLLIIIIGYNRWRNICPLSLFAKLTQNVYLFKKKKVPLWFEENIYIVQFSTLLLAFTLRFYCLNDSSLLLNIFFISVISLALLSGLFFTGKTWCNFFCPVSLVERIYTSSSSHKANINSACSTCSACKNNCPDIDMESSYWKEGENQKKKLAFYSFPGLVLGFYTYYYLRAGSWDYYFSGEWTQNSLSVYEHLFSDGFFFLNDIPLLIAAPLTLLIFSYMSYVLFLLFETLLSALQSTKDKDQKTLVHITNTVAAFCAFNIFYIFAGAPTYSNYPVFYTAFHFFLIVASSTLLYREIFREEKYFLQEKFARKILQKWTAKTPPSKNLKEIYYTYVNQQKDHKKHLEIYKETIEELFYNGILSVEHKKLVEKFQKQFNITEEEHENIVASFKRACTDISQQPLELSSEKLYQLQHYRAALAKLISQNPVNLEKSILHLQTQFDIDDEEHAYIFNKIVNKDGLIHDQINILLNEIIDYTKFCKSYNAEQSLWLRYLYFVLDENRISLMQELKKLLMLLFTSHETKKILQRLHTDDATEKEFLIELIGSKHKELIEKFSELFDVNMTTEKEFFKGHLPEMIKHLLKSSNNKIVACAIYVAAEEYDDAVERFYLNDFRQHDSFLIKEVALKVLNTTEALTQIEKEAYLQKVPLFSNIKSHDLSKLASEMLERKFNKDETIVSQNDSGDSLFIFTHGQAIVSVEEKNTEKEIANIHEGDYIGEISILSKLPRTATVTAKTPVTCLELSGEAFKAFIVEHPLVSLKLMQEITKRLIELKA